MEFFSDMITATKDGLTGLKKALLSDSSNYET